MDWMSNCLSFISKFVCFFLWLTNIRILEFVCNTRTSIMARVNTSWLFWWILLLLFLTLRSFLLILFQNQAVSLFTSENDPCFLLNDCKADMVILIPLLWFFLSVKTLKFYSHKIWTDTSNLVGKFILNFLTLLSEHKFMHAGYSLFRTVLLHPSKEYWWKHEASYFWQLLVPCAW